MIPGPLPNARLIFAWLACFLPLSCSGGCGDTPGSRDRPLEHNPPPQDGAPPTPAATRASEEAVARAATDAGAADPRELADAGAPQPWPGPFFIVTSSSTGIYLNPIFDRTLKIGYARSGGRLPVFAEKVSGDGCRAGFYPIVHGGYICSSEGTIDPADPRGRLAVQPPDLDAVLPYPYARNARNGTPLYTSVPSADQMAAYEPYLEPAEGTQRDQAALDAGSRPWWQKADAPLSEVRLAQLALESDGVLNRRMVRGFYIAVDKEFEWGSRTWYKTTRGMVAPKDRFVAVEGATFQGVELSEEQTLPVAWAYGFKQTRPKYELSPAGKLKQVGVFNRYEALHLMGDASIIEGRSYVQAKEGFWVQSEHVRVARPPRLPAQLAPDEHWIYVDLRAQVLVASIGSTPVYTTLVSSGKESDDEAKDHRTPPGEWNIREKHLTTTMDGDGTAAGDLPYSIEDVPYVMYFQGSYALHGAFWHRNYGVRMSHGCINLAPLDAKYLFFFTGPGVREGWHGAWSGNGQAGSRIVIDGPERGSRAGL
jgi:lipoprotein-anchoring transpeptidase ErfK/SrfK